MKRIVLILTLTLPLLAAAQAPASSADTANDLESESQNIPDPDECIELDTVPDPLNFTTFINCLTYPKDARNAGLEGRVIVKLLIDKKGIPIQHIIKETPHKVFNKSVESCIYALRYPPVILKGDLIYYWVTVPVKFEL